MKGFSFKDILARLVGHSEGTFIRIVSNLLEGDIIPRHSDLTNHDATALFTALVGSHQPRNAVKVVGAYNKCVNANGEPFFSKLDKAFSSPATAMQIDKLIICQTIAEATIIWDNGQSEVFRYKNGVDSPLMRIDATVNGAVIHELSFKLNVPEEPDSGVLMGDAVNVEVKRIKTLADKDRG